MNFLTYLPTSFVLFHDVGGLNASTEQPPTQSSCCVLLKWFRKNISRYIFWGLLLGYLQTCQRSVKKSATTRYSFGLLSSNKNGETRVILHYSAIFFEKEYMIQTALGSSFKLNGHNFSIDFNVFALATTATGYDVTVYHEILFLLRATGLFKTYYYTSLIADTFFMLWYYKTWLDFIAYMYVHNNYEHFYMRGEPISWCLLRPLYASL